MRWLAGRVCTGYAIMLCIGFIVSLTNKQAAERILVETGGINMNTWLVGRHPIGFYTKKHQKAITNEETKQEELGMKTFFMKMRIMAGQVNLKDNKFGLADYKWLSKEEIQNEVDPSYWRQTRHMLVEL